ncbi:hypothetical protein Mgra_00008559, partial [Meloidogyne graminicola]
FKWLNYQPNTSFNKKLLFATKHSNFYPFYFLEKQATMLCSLFILELLVLSSLCSIEVDFDSYASKLSIDLTELETYIIETSFLCLNNLNSEEYWEMQPFNVKKYLLDLNNVEKLPNFKALYNYVGKFFIKNDFSAKHKVGLNTIPDAFAQVDKTQLTEDGLKELIGYTNKINHFLKNKEEINKTVEEAKKIFLTGQPVDVFNAIPIKIINSISGFKHLTETIRKYIKNELKIDLKKEKEELRSLEDSLKIKNPPEMEEKEIEAFIESKKLKKLELNSLQIYIKIYEKMNKTFDNIEGKIKKNFLENYLYKSLAKHYIDIRLYIGLINTAKQLYKILKTIEHKNKLLNLKLIIILRKVINGYLQRLNINENQIIATFEIFKLPDIEEFLSNESDTICDQIEKESSNLKNYSQTFLPYIKADKVILLNDKIKANKIIDLKKEGIDDSVAFADTITELNNDSFAKILIELYQGE